MTEDYGDNNEKLVISRGYNKDGRNMRYLTDILAN